MLYYQTNAETAKRKPRATPLWKQGPFNVSRLFQIAFDKFVEITKQSYKNSVVVCSNFTSRFHIVFGRNVFNETLSFFNVTFHSLASVYRIHNMTVRMEGNNTAVSDAWLACREVFVRYVHCVPFKFFLSDIAICNVLSPYVRVTVKYYFISKKVELVWARFGRMRHLVKEYHVPIRDEYDVFKKQLGELLFDRFLYYDKFKVDDTLYDRFRTAIQLSGINDVMNITVKPNTSL